jgi:hypothetical protein
MGSKIAQNIARKLLEKQFKDDGSKMTVIVNGLLSIE